MIKFSEAASLALHTVVMLSERDEVMSAKEISSKLSASEAHLAKILQRLAKAGLINSQRGPKGGFSMSKKAKNASLLEVYEAIEGKPTLSACLFTTPICRKGTNCIMGDLLKRLDRDIYQYLADTRIRDIKSDSIFKK